MGKDEVRPSAATATPMAAAEKGLKLPLKAQDLSAIVRPEDSVVQTVRLEGIYPERMRFLCVVNGGGGMGGSDSGDSGGEHRGSDYCLLGVDMTAAPSSPPTTKVPKLDADAIEAGNVAAAVKGDEAPSVVLKKPGEMGEEKPPTPAPAAAVKDPTTTPNTAASSLPTLGFVVRILWDTEVTLDGDGGFSIFQRDDLTTKKHFIFKPVSVQALWTVIQTLHMIKEQLRPALQIAASSADTRQAGLGKLAADYNDWISRYEKEVKSSQSCINEWHAMADLLSKRPASPSAVMAGDAAAASKADAETTIKSRLRAIMKRVDLDTITSKKIRHQLEEEMGMSLESFKSFIDTEILLILGQMDPASKILDYLYLGSEWNASNLEELGQNSITHILNVTREIDNFFPANFEYKNIRVYDEEATDLLRHFDTTYRFIREAKEKGGHVLVHCKMGISRSASVVISFMMKEYELELAQTLIRVKELRSVVNPNKSFIKQLEVYEGMLGAIRHRLTYCNRQLLTRSKSESSLIQSCSSSSTVSNVAAAAGADAQSSSLHAGGGTSDLTSAAFTPSRRNRVNRSHSSRVAETYCKSVDVKALSAAYNNKLSESNGSSTAAAAAEASNKLSQLAADFTTSNSDGGGGGRPKSWSPNEKAAQELLLKEDCKCFNDLSQNCAQLMREEEDDDIGGGGQKEEEKESGRKNCCLPEEETRSANAKCDDDSAAVAAASAPQSPNKEVATDRREDDAGSGISNQTSSGSPTAASNDRCTSLRPLIPPPSPVNSTHSPAFNPDCDCDVEVELRVPDEPVKIDDPNPDERTDIIVEHLANVPLQIKSQPPPQMTSPVATLASVTSPAALTAVTTPSAAAKSNTICHKPPPAAIFKQAFSKSSNGSLAESSLSSVSSTSSSNTSSAAVGAAPAATSKFPMASSLTRRSSAAGDYFPAAVTIRQAAGGSQTLPPPPTAATAGHRESLPPASPPVNGGRGGGQRPRRHSFDRRSDPTMTSSSLPTIHCGGGGGEEGGREKGSGGHEFCDATETNRLKDVLSVKTLANFFSNSKTAPSPTTYNKKSCARLEDNKLFQKAKIRIAGGGGGDSSDDNEASAAAAATPGKRKELSCTATAATTGGGGGKNRTKNNDRKKLQQDATIYNNNASAILIHTTKVSSESDC